MAEPKKSKYICGGCNRKYRPCDVINCQAPAIASGGVPATKRTKEMFGPTIPNRTTRYTCKHHNYLLSDSWHYPQDSGNLLE